MQRNGLPAWNDKATVRIIPHLLLNPDQSGYFFPISRQPLSLHPFIEKLHDKELTYLLTQSFYKYTNDISTIETRVVNQTILKNLHNNSIIQFNDQQKADLYTIMIDESYHAYVAHDAMLQVQTHTGIQPLSLPQTIEIEHAINTVKRNLAPRYHSLFELIAVCLAENTLTHDIVGMLHQTETHPFFQHIIKNHLSDESRHSRIFFGILSFIWSNIPEDYRYALGNVLPEFLEQYLGLTVQIAFDKTVLINMGLTLNDVDMVISDTYRNFRLTRHHPLLKNLLIILAKADVLNETNLPTFKEKNWL